MHLTLNVQAALGGQVLDSGPEISDIQAGLRRQGVAVHVLLHDSAKHELGIAKSSLAIVVGRLRHDDIVIRRLPARQLEMVFGAL